MKPLNNEDGMILLTVLILMFIATLLGVISINSSTIEVQISGNDRRVATGFAAAEAGLDIAIPVIEQTIGSPTLSPSVITVSGTDAVMDTANSQLYKEITDPDYAYDAHGADSTDSDTPDISIADLGGAEVNIDIDRLFSEIVAGGALEFAMGYEGVGAGAAGGGVILYYSIKSAGAKN